MYKGAVLNLPIYWDVWEGEPNVYGWCTAGRPLPGLYPVYVDEEEKDI